jgi:phenylacetate-coenzyme A ligase PaaK-like adenylate-forming protein
MKISPLNITKNTLIALWTQRGGQKRIEAVQRRRLRRLVEKARRDSPLFGELYADLTPSGKVRLQDLPITRRSELMDQFDRWLTDRSLTKARIMEHMADLNNIGVPIANTLVVRTSGTTGEPVFATIPASVLEVNPALKLRGDDKGTKVVMSELNRELRRRGGARVMIAGGDGHFGSNTVSTFNRRQSQRYNSNSTFIRAEDPVDSIVRQLNALNQVSTLTLYPSMLMILVHEVEAERLKIDPLLIQLSGETLTDEMRQSVFKPFPSVHIINSYQTSECLMLGKECSHRRMHVQEDWVILEAIDGNEQPIPDGVLSDAMLLTFLANDLQPFIRYKMGDRIRFFTDPCPCGLPFRSFAVEGRQAIILRIGEVVMSALALHMKHEQASRVQLVQREEREFEVRVEIRPEADVEAVFDHIIAKLQADLRKNSITDAVIGKSDQPPIIGDSGKFRKIIPMIKGLSPPGRPYP